MRTRYRDAIRDAMREEMQADERVILLGEDVADPWGGTWLASVGLSTEFGRARVRNMPIAENLIVGAALGCALTGLRPVAEMMYEDFSMLAMDQIVNQVAKFRYMTGGQTPVPLVIRMAGGGYRSAAAQHSQSLEAFFAHVPGLLVAAPSNPADAKGLLKTAIRLDDPVVVLEHKAMYADFGEVPEGDHLVPFGQAAMVRPGRDVTIVAWSKMVGLSLQAATALAERGIDAEVIDLRTLVPLDEESILDSVARTGRIVIVHEANRRGGYGGEIAAIVAERIPDLLKAPIQRVAARGVPIPMAPILERAVLPDAARIEAAASLVCEGAA